MLKFIKNCVYKNLWMIMMETVTILLTCPDRKGIVAGVTDFLYKNNGNILHADQHIDDESKTLFMRIEFDSSDFAVENEKIKEKFGEEVGKKFGMQYSVKFSSEIQNVAIFVGKEEHCLFEILLKQKAKELKCNVPLIISNHPDMENIAKFFNCEYYVIEKTSENKIFQEAEELKLLKKFKIDTVVLAKYMQILSPYFIENMQNRIINVHHSFLPAFKGAKPYLQAYKRGVKLIGATAHYVTEELDNGPIIEQEIVRVSHRDTLADFIEKGKDVEKMVLIKALKAHLENKILVYENKTIVFD